MTTKRSNKKKNGRKSKTTPASGSQKPSNTSSSRSPSPSDQANKRAKNSNEETMDVEETTETQASPAQDASSSLPDASSFPQNNVQVVITQPPPAETLDASIHAPTNTSPATKDSTSGKGKDKDNSEVTFEKPTRTASPDAAQATIQHTSSLFHVRANPGAAPDFTTKYKIKQLAIDAIRSYFARFPAYAGRVFVSGNDAEGTKRYSIAFRSESDLDSCIQEPIKELDGLLFHKYSPQDEKAELLTKQIFVSDIPLAFTETQLRSIFSRYGNISRITITTKRLYQQAIVTFDSPASVSQFESQLWSVIGCDECLRVVPVSFFQQQWATRNDHVAILAGLPRNTHPGDLVAIAEQVNAKLSISPDP